MRSFQPASKINIMPSMIATMEHNFKKKQAANNSPNHYMVPQNGGTNKRMGIDFPLSNKMPVRNTNYPSIQPVVIPTQP